MLEELFVKIVGMSLTAGIVIVVVLIARIFLKRFPKSISYMLWSVVLFRLLCPISFEASFSPVPNISDDLYQNRVEISHDIPANIGELVVPDDITNEVPSIDAAIETITNEAEGKAESSWRELFLFYGKYLWISGIIIMLFYAVFSFVRIQKKVAVSLPLKKKIYITDGIVTPFVMGIISPKIYLPEHLSQKEQEYIILHERIHIRRFDHIIKLVAFGALSIHWFNPLVWIAFIFFCKDMEMSCDEAVIKKLGEDIRADYADSLLALSIKKRFIYEIPVMFGEGDTKGRIKNLASYKKIKKSILCVVALFVGVLVVCLIFNHKSLTSNEENIVIEDNSADQIEDLNQLEVTNENDETEKLQVTTSISEYYITNTGDPGNLYYIDENKVLWGCGRNNCGQLGQGTQDYDFHNEMVKIAENVIHVDYSQRDFAIFLTEDNKLYGVGNAGSGALQQYDKFDMEKYMNPEHYFINEPYLLMEDVSYARCGRDDIVCLKTDGTVWTWGTIYLTGVYGSVYYIQEPEKILENAVFVTGGWFNHAALLRDGTVWTWGYNSAGNCGVADEKVVEKPTMVFEDAVMVWTGRIVYNIDCQDITEFDGIYPGYLNNTIVKKADGSNWICGENVGTQEKVIAGAEGEYTAVCSSEFMLLDSEKEEFMGIIVNEKFNNDGQSADSNVEEAIDTIMISADRKLRDGYEEVKLTYVDNSEVGWNYYSVNPWGTDEARDALAQTAMKELYTLTGYQVEECVYTTDGRSRFIFGQSEKRIKQSCAFCSRDFGYVLAGDNVPYAGYVNARRVQYSDVQQIDSPYGKAEYSGHGAIPVYFLSQSGVYQGEKIIDFDVVNLEDTVYTHVKLLFNGGYYMVVLDDALESVAEVSGPYYEDEKTEIDYKANEYLESYQKAVEKEYRLPGTEIYYRMAVADAAAGSRMYVLLKSIDGGENWYVRSGDPFGDSMGGSIEFTFLDEGFGFATLSHNGGDEAVLYRTTNGGKSYSQVQLIDNPEVLLDNDTLYEPYDYPQMPFYDGGDLVVLVGQGADGDYAGGDSKQLARFVSKNDGKSFRFDSYITN